MTVYLDQHQIAERLGVPLKTARALMMQMNPIPISGTVRRRYRVTEENLDRFMEKRMIGKPKTGRSTVGSTKKLARR